MSLDLQFFDAVGALDASQWDALVADASPFLEHGFLVTLEETGCVGEGTGWYPQILGAFRDGELVGALPLYLKTDSRGEFVFDWSWADAAHRAGMQYYPKAVVAVPFTPIEGRRILVDESQEDAGAIRRALVEAAIDFAQRAQLSSLHFNFVLPEEVELFEDLGLPIREGLQYHWYNGPDLGVGDDYGDFDDYLARFRSKKRSNIRRERRKLAEAGVTTKVLVGDEVTPAHLDRMFDYYRDTIEKFYWGKQYLNRAFFEQLGQALGDRVHMVVAEHDGREFAGAFNLWKGDGLYGRYWGCLDEIKYAHFEVCLYRAVEWCIDHGVQKFEPGAQGEHKYDRGFMPTPTYSAHWVRHPGLARAIADFIAQEKWEVERQIEAMREDSPYKDG
ncbi:GNAT family N-acetyltransferase [Persicimonas caeni]|nr:GNAT family N-acetyltransferase [Persicimonas caeni]